MAVIITDMDMQSACCYSTGKNFEYCKLYDCCKHRETIKVDVKPSDCPLKEVPSGKWIPIGYDGYADGNPVYDVWECSNCGYEHNGENDTLTAYCPDCGCNMVDLG